MAAVTSFARAKFIIQKAQRNNTTMNSNLIHIYTHIHKQAIVRNVHKKRRENQIRKIHIKIDLNNNNSKGMMVGACSRYKKCK